MQNRVTLKDVARESGVSTATVSYVYNGKKSISEKTKQRVLAAIEKLNYIPDLSARTLSAHKSKLIGVVVPQTEPGDNLMFTNSFYSEILGSIELQARLRGYHVIVSGTDVDEDYRTIAKERNVDGIIVVGMYPNEFYRQMKDTNLPIVLVDSYCNDHYYHNVRVDDAYGSYLATKYVIEKGHVDIAFLCGMIRDNGVVQKRLAGYKDALSESGISFRKEYIFEGKVDGKHGVALAKKILKNQGHITAVVATADILAIGAIKGFYEQGVKVPEQISVIGFDDLQISDYVVPGLTTIRQEISQKGEKAIELLFQHMEGHNSTKREVVLPISVVERGSVKAL